MAVVSRLELNHPGLGAAGGAGLHASIEALYQKIGDAIDTRWFSLLDFDQTETVDLQHNFNTDITNLRYDFYNFVGGEWILLTDSTSPLRSAFSVVEKVGFANTVLQITNNTGGNDLTFAVVVVNDPIYLSQDDVKDVDLSGIQDGQSLVYNASSKKLVAGASGDSSFKLQTVATPTLTLKGGYEALADGRELATYSGSGTVLASYGVDLSLNLTTILGGAPANATNYYLYLDLTTLGAVQTISDTGRKVYRIVQANFVLSTVAPETVLTLQPNRYVPIGNILSATSGTAWSGAGSAFTTYSTKKHFNGPAFDATTAPEDGQALVFSAATGKYTPGASGDSSFKLQSVATPTLSLKGGSIIDGDDEYVTYDGSGALSTDYGTDLSLNLTTILGSSPANATTYFLFIDKFTLSTEATLTDNGRQLYAVQQANFVLSTTRHRDPNRYVYVGFVRSATTGTVWSGAGAAFGTEPYRRHDRMSRFYSFPEVLATTAITSATATNTINHNFSGKPQHVWVTYFDGTNEFPADQPTVVKNVTSTQIIVNSLGFTFGGGQELRVYAVRLPTQQQIAAPSTQKSFGWYTSTATTTVAHGMDIEDIRGMQLEEWNTTTGKYRILPADIVVNFDTTNITLNWTGYSPSATLQYRLNVGGTPVPYSFPLIYGGYTKFVGTGPGSYATVTAALAASVAGDSILVARDTDETADLSIPAGVRVDQMPNTTVRLAGSLTNGVRFTGAKAVWKNMNVRVSPTGTQAKGISVEAADCWVDGWIELATAQTLTDALNVAVGGVRAKVSLGVLKTLGTITNLETNNDGASSTSVWGG